MCVCVCVCEFSQISETDSWCSMDPEEQDQFSSLSRLRKHKLFSVLYLCKLFFWTVGQTKHDPTMCIIDKLIDNENNH